MKINRLAHLRLRMKAILSRIWGQKESLNSNKNSPLMAVNSRGQLLSYNMTTRYVTEGTSRKSQKNTRIGKVGKRLLNLFCLCGNKKEKSIKISYLEQIGHFYDYKIIGSELNKKSALYKHLWGLHDSIS